MDTNFETITVDECENIINSRIKKCLVRNTSKEFVDWALAHNKRRIEPYKEVVSQYAKDMARNNWKLTESCMVFSLDGDLFDGLHRLLANREAGYPPVPMTICFGFSVELGQHKCPKCGSAL